LQYLKDSGLDIDLDGLLQARKRIIIKDLFFDPEEAERRRKAVEVGALLFASSKTCRCPLHFPD